MHILCTYQGAKIKMMILVKQIGVGPNSRPKLWVAVAKNNIKCLKTIFVNSYSAGVDLRLQNLTSADVRILQTSDFDV